MKDAAERCPGGPSNLRFVAGQRGVERRRRGRLRRRPARHRGRPGRFASPASESPTRPWVAQAACERTRGVRGAPRGENRIAETTRGAISTASMTICERRRSAARTVAAGAGASADRTRSRSRSGGLRAGRRRAPRADGYAGAHRAPAMPSRHHRGSAPRWHPASTNAPASSASVIPASRCDASIAAAARIRSPAIASAARG